MRSGTRTRWATAGARGAPAGHRRAAGTVVRSAAHQRVILHGAALSDLPASHWQLRAHSKTLTRSNTISSGSLDPRRLRASSTVAVICSEEAVEALALRAMQRTRPANRRLLAAGTAGLCREGCPVALPRLSKAQPEPDARAGRALDRAATRALLWHCCSRRRRISGLTASGTTSKVLRLRSSGLPSGGPHTDQGGLRGAQGGWAR